MHQQQRAVAHTKAGQGGGDARLKRKKERREGKMADPVREELAGWVMVRGRVVEGIERGWMVAGESQREAR